MPLGITLGAVAIGGMAVDAWGKKKAGDAAKKAGVEVGAAQKAASESQAQLADYNANVATLQAQDALERGAEEESFFRSQVRGAIGAQRAGIAAGNTDVGFGSAVDVQADAAFLGELDSLTIRTNAAREAWGFTVQAEDLRKRAEIARKEGVYLEKGAITQGNAQKTASNYGIASGLLGGGASLFAMSYGFRGSSGGGGGYGKGFVGPKQG